MGHEMLTGQLKVMSDATAGFTPPVRSEVSFDSEQPSSWSMGTRISKGVSDATSSAFATPETALRWFTRTAVTVAGVYALGRYGKAPALKVAHSAQKIVAAAGT